MIRRLVSASPILFVLACAVDFDDIDGSRLAGAQVDERAPAYAAERRFPLLPLPRPEPAVRPVSLRR